MAVGDCSVGALPRWSGPSEEPDTASAGQLLTPFTAFAVSADGNQPYNQLPESAVGCVDWRVGAIVSLSAHIMVDLH